MKKFDKEIFKTDNVKISVSEEWMDQWNNIYKQIDDWVYQYLYSKQDTMQNCGYVCQIKDNVIICNVYHGEEIIKTWHFELIGNIVNVSLKTVYCVNCNKSFDVPIKSIRSICKDCQGEINRDNRNKRIK